MVVPHARGCGTTTRGPRLTPVRGQCAYELLPVRPGEGGFGCCPGTHRPEVYDRLQRMPAECRSSWADSPWTQRHSEWDESVPVEVLALSPGDCLLFTEKLSHATAPWTGRGERRTLFYKYVSYGQHHTDRGYDVCDPLLSPRQRDMVGFPEMWFSAPTGANQDYENNPALRRLHPLATAAVWGNGPRL